MEVSDGNGNENGNDNDKETTGNSPGGSLNPTDTESFTDEDGNYHSGSLIIDATCCAAEVKYPTDIDVLNDAVEVSARVVKRLCTKTGSPVPRTFEKAARRKFLSIVKRKKKSKGLIRKGIKQQLHYLHRHIDAFVAQVARQAPHALIS